MVTLYSSEGVEASHGCLVSFMCGGGSTCMEERRTDGTRTVRSIGERGKRNNTSIPMPNGCLPPGEVRVELCI